MKRGTTIIGGCLVLVLATGATADVVIGGITFDDTAFADELISSAGTWTILGDGANLEDVLLGSDITNGAFPEPVDALVDNVVLGFTDNVIWNGPGDDVALFEYGNVEDWAAVSITVGGIAQTYQSIDTGQDVFIRRAGPYNLNVIKVDLDDFGVPAGAALNMLQILPLPDGSAGTTFTLNTIGAIHIPEPAPLLLVAIGLLYSAGRRR